MATGAAPDGFLRCGCISGFDSLIERRPYHKNCRCALHEKKNGAGCALAGAGKNRSISYPIRKVWSEGNLAMMANNNQTSPANSPAVAPPKGKLRRFGSSSSIREIDEEWKD